MIKYHGKNFGIKDLKDFFSVDPVDEDKTEEDDSEDACEVRSTILHVSPHFITPALHNVGRRREHLTSIINE